MDTHMLGKKLYDLCKSKDKIVEVRALLESLTEEQRRKVVTDHMHEVGESYALDYQISMLG